MIMMKKWFHISKILLIAAIASSCSSGGGAGTGELVGARKSSKWFEPVPNGMTFVHRGTMKVGPSDEDVSASLTPARTVSVEAFWMDDTEITNNEYTQFVHWVRDSIARSLLKEGANPDADLFILQNEEGDELGLNWNQKIRWDDPEYREDLEDMYIPERERFFGKREIDSRKLFYRYFWIDLKQAARRENSYNFATESYEGNIINAQGELMAIEDRSSFIMEKRVHIYPDTLCWIRDYTFSYNEPWTTKYFWHPGFMDYPVVGVDWEQATAFCHWRSKMQNSYLAQQGEAAVQDYRLPSEIEWEYAARGGKNNTVFPWGGYYTRNQDGSFMANFKPLRGNYIEDGGLVTMMVASYDPNDFGLYDMAGNVAEWTRSAYHESAYAMMSDLNPSFEYNARPDDPPALKRKIVRGGSWKDVSFFLRNSTRSWEYQDTSKSFIGFRCVRPSFKNDF